jgi:hypothetical protein
MSVTVLDQGRRAHRRFPVRFRLHCRRLGRPGYDEIVEAVDLSAGGMRFQAAGDLATGDVVLLTFELDRDRLEITGLVVHVSRWGTGAAAHVAFTSVDETRRTWVERLLAVHEESRRIALSPGG